jgi:hypothetical protein
MIEETDTELKRRWDRLLADIERSKQGYIAPGMSKGQYREQLDAERETVQLLWENLLLRRKHGELTDTSRIDEIKNLISEMALWQAFPIRFSQKESTRRDGDDFSVNWSLVATYSGETRTLDWMRWDKFADKVQTALDPFDYVVGIPRWQLEFDPTEIPRDYFERNYDLPGAPKYTGDDSIDFPDDKSDEGAEPDASRLYIPHDPYLRPSQSCLIDTWTWDGPPTRRRRSRI